MKKTYAFLTQLKKNNNKPWMDTHKAEYENVKAEQVDFLNEIIPLVQSIDGAVQHIEPKDCMFRINRDIRFSKDKTPYKENIGLVVAPGGKKSLQACYYFHIEPKQSMVAGGIWMPDANRLSKIRQEIDYNGSAFKKVFASKSVKSFFEDFDADLKLVNPPKGYEANNEFIEWLKLKSFTVSKTVSDDFFKEPSIKEIKKYVEALHQINNLLNQAIEN
jgi:uncharacterized protein (TIGR02453 family)